MSTVAECVAEVRDQIARACEAVGRDPAEITLVGVTKTHPPDKARELVAAGVADLGENRAQELLAKAPLVEGARWHMIGQMQRNKVQSVLATGAWIHSVDRRSLVDTIERRAEQAGVTANILVQVNVGDDPAKGGCHLTETLDLVAYASAMPHVVVQGLMTVPPVDAPARPLFTRLASLRDEAVTDWPTARHLSMGMSADLTEAVAAGATIVRIGTALLGTRGTSAWKGT